MSTPGPTQHIHDGLIDPALLILTEAPAPTTGSISPEKDADGNVVSEFAFNEYLETIRTKEPLRATCNEHGLSFSKKANLAELRHIVLIYWYPQSTHQLPARPRPPRKPRRQLSPSDSILDSPRSSSPPSNFIPFIPPSTDSTPLQHVRAEDVDLDDDESALISRFNPGDDAAEELLQYVDDRLGDEDEDDGEGLDLEDDDDFVKYQAGTRVGAAQRSETNRRIGGLRTQKSVVKSWDKFLDIHLTEKKVRDRIVDVHSLLLFIKWSAERPKMNRKGEDRPGTFISASQLKKLFFGVLRVRKVQEAADTTLAMKRPATTVHVYDAIKNRMDEALERERSGLVPNEDAPDIVANTFLAQVTDKQLELIGLAFLEHPQLRMVINGHLAWVCQNASGNRGDDFRALKLCETQPYTWLHPNGHTAVYSVLGLQGEEKAGRRGMKTTVNPVYTTFIAHLNPELCPLGALAFYNSYVHDHYGLTEKMNIDWSVNKSWRRIRLLFGKSPLIPYNESNLYNLYVNAYKRSGFESKIKVHMARRQLGYKQEQLGVASEQTSKLGWSRGTYVDTYAPALAKTAILGAHGYKATEEYNPVWRLVHVPAAFLLLMCPMAEEILERIEGKKNLTGASNYWQMVVSLRPYFFQCGAALFQRRPESALFRLPAFQNADVRAWMTNTFPSELSVLQANAGSPVDLQRIANDTIRIAFEEQRVLLAAQSTQLRHLTDLIQRRTSVLSPTQGYSQDQYSRSANSAHAPTTPLLTLTPEPSTAQVYTSPGPVDQATRAVQDTGVYLTADGEPRGYICPSPSAPDAPRTQTPVDLVLPPVQAFSRKDEAQLLWPPILGQRSVQWADVFKLIKRPELLWEVYQPRLTLDQYSIKGLWTCYNVGEAAVDSAGHETGLKPPLRLVEQHFSFQWRRGTQAKKCWERFREIPEWIESESKLRSISPERVMAELEVMRQDGTNVLGMNRLQNKVKALRKAKALQIIEEAHPSLPVSSSPSAAPSRPSSRLSQADASLAHGLCILPATSSLGSPPTSPLASSSTSSSLPQVSSSGSILQSPFALAPPASSLLRLPALAAEPLNPQKAPKKRRAPAIAPRVQPNKKLRMGLKNT